MTRNMLIVDEMHPSIFDMLSSIGWTFDYRPELSRDDIRKIIGNYTGLMIRSKTRVDRDLLGDNPSLRVIARAGAGLDNLDEGFLLEKSIAVVHAAEGNRDAVGEFTLGLLLSLCRNIAHANVEVRNKVWDREGNRGFEIVDKTVGIIGFGNMGSAFAKRLSGFGCKILGYDKYKSGFGNSFVTESTLENLLETSDVISLHIPLTVETRGWVDDIFFKRCRKPILFINTARGEIVRLDALDRALESGEVLGAALDVLENEKLNTLTPEQQRIFNNLSGRTNVILTPHIAGWTFESHVKINVALVDKMKALIF